MPAKLKTQASLNTLKILTNVLLENKSTIDQLWYMQNSLLWNNLIALALKNNSLPLFLTKIKKHAKGSEFPESIALKLQHSLSKIIKNDLHRRSVLNEIAKIFDNEGILFILLKGADIQHRLYDEPFLRPMIDLDLLVKGDNIAKAQNILLKKGGKSITISESEFIDSLKHHASPIIYNNTTIELHRSLTDDYDTISFNETDIWQNCTTQTIDGHDYNVMKPELLLVYLCFHAFSTFRGGAIKLIWYYDIFRCFEKYSNSINLSLLHEIVKKSGTSAAIALSLKHAEYLFHSEALAKFTKQFPCPVAFNEKQLVATLLGNEYSFPKGHYFQKFLNIKGTQLKMKFIINKLFPSKAFVNSNKKSNKSKTINRKKFRKLRIFTQGIGAFFVYLYYNLKKQN